MRFAVSRNPRLVRRERRDRLLRVLMGALGSSVVAGAGLLFGFGLGLQEARWNDVLAEVGQASFVFTAADIRRS